MEILANIDPNRKYPLPYIIRSKIKSLSVPQQKELLKVLENGGFEPEKATDLGDKQLKDFRERLKKYGSRWNNDRMVAAADAIPVKIRIDKEGNRLIKFRVGIHTYKMLDIEMENFFDSEYMIRMHNNELVGINNQAYINPYVTGDNINKRKSDKILGYIKKKQEEGRRIPTYDEIRKLLDRLHRFLDSRFDGKFDGCYSDGHWIEILMYLIGIYGEYIFSFNGGELGSLWCNNYNRMIGHYIGGGLLMVPSRNKSKFKPCE